VRFRSGATLFLPVLSLGLGVFGCTRYVTLERLPQAYYQTAPPTRDISTDLEGAFQAVKRIRVTAVYDHYGFSPESAPLEGVPLSPQVMARAVDTFSSSTSREASAVQIAQTGLRVTLLTNDHALQFPDTLLEYAEASEEERAAREPRTVHRVSVKRTQYDMVVDRDALYVFQILAEDARSDLAALGVLYPNEVGSRSLSILRVPVGDSERLSWGSFVYVLGHPGGFPLVTRGIVSDPGRQSLSSFIIDGLWNEGTSGGPILAIRGDDESLEWVGMARAAAGKLEHRLVPDPEVIPGEDKRVPYDGRIYLEEVQRILYGISFSVPMSEIREFMDRNRDRLRRGGWALPSF